ncbi:MFS transporter [Stakelama sp. CBK3Z-3]|uniref:MFS transporter n=1 Tax=Stakelama flava TaxID=2860338 RepID=A0ABS6XPJ2_9SPHN|nr:MFS transporter [Stakelama flava]MBW4332140.1 MFS transporter [Stakelama flava]
MSNQNGDAPASPDPARPDGGAPSAGSESAPSKGRFKLAMCFLVAALEGYDIQVISSAAPQLRVAMNLRPDQIGIFFAATLIGLAIGAVLGGWFSDRYGRKPVLIGSVCALGLFTFLTTLVTSYDGLLITRILAGIGLGGAMPTLIATVAELSGGRRTTSAVTTMICGQPTGGIVSALTGQTIANAFGWQSLFFTGGVLTLLIVPFVIFLIPETGKPLHHEARTPQMPAARALFGDGRTASTLLLWLIFILALALLSILLSWTPLLVIGKGLGKMVGLNTVIAINFGGILGGLAISRLIDRHGVRWPMIALFAIVTVSLFLFANAASSIAMILLGVAVGFGVLGAQFTLYGIAPRLYPVAGRGSGVGIAVAMGRVGSILGPILIGDYIHGGASENEAVLLMMPAAVIAGLAVFLLANSSKGVLDIDLAAGPQK